MYEYDLHPGAFTHGLGRVPLLANDCSHPKARMRLRKKCDLEPGVFLRNAYLTDNNGHLIVSTILEIPHGN